MITLLKKCYRQHLRWKEADKRGWQCLGRMMLTSKDWSEDKWARELRYEKRIYRLTRGSGNPWRD
jgi:hypothetical protein